MQNLKVQISPVSYEIKEYDDHTEINSYGEMHTFVGEKINEYHLTIINFQPGNAHLQLGFCDDGFQIQSAYRYDRKNFSGTLFYGVGDDKEGRSGAFDPMKDATWQNGKPKKKDKYELKNGDVFICKYKKNKIIITSSNGKASGVYKVELDTKHFVNAKPCFSLMGNITVKVCKNKKERVYSSDDSGINYNTLKI